MEVQTTHAKILQTDEHQTMAALHYMLDYVLRTSPSDLLPERTDANTKQTEPIEHVVSREHDQPLKKHFKDHISRTPELTHHGPHHNPPQIGTDERSLTSSYQRIIDSQREQIESLERNLSIQRRENRELRELVSHLKDTISNLTYHTSPRKRLASLAFDEQDDGYHDVQTSARKNRKPRANSPDLSDDDVEDEDYNDFDHPSPKRRRSFKSKEERGEASVFEEHQYGYSDHKLPTSKIVRPPVTSLPDNKFVLPPDIHLEKKYFLKWGGEIYAVAKAFGDRNRLRKLVAKYESETDKKASYLLDGEELRKLKAINPICHNTSYLGLYNLEFVRYFQNMVSA
jgi:hypothetical protein